ncbi:TPA: hypothetical protein ACF2DS_002365 [Clostridium perfringens]|uniref:hypothetical protein n=1 Tax=Clostridium perfringens TaxID=1502 RepID=UPI0018E45A2D|nr:hypothetical protein [Clostridium perfringens]EHR1328794.1 hypothetical protein [Clostridium perfringens]EHR1331927.1 hypothetical protein [Clostridium perfringens]EHR1425404.1 hypothetical protein [Clostridium perfringens]EIF2086688.1 hypothetical protein [Clostridium perfringens]EIF6165321.1 hypothetical protein [Clostridium perfringens]
MANKNKNKFNKNKEKVVDVKYAEVKEQQEVKPTFETGNYVVSVVANGEIIKKIAIAGAEIYVTKLADGGLTVDLK